MFANTFYVDPFFTLQNECKAKNIMTTMDIERFNHVINYRCTAIFFDLTYFLTFKKLIKNDVSVLVAKPISPSYLYYRQYDTARKSNKRMKATFTKNTITEKESCITNKT